MNTFGWDLPPGVSQRDIDEAMGGDDGPDREAIADARAEREFERRYQEDER